MGTRFRLSSVLAVALIALIGTPALLAAQEDDIGEPIGTEPGVFLRPGDDQPGQSGEALRSNTLTFNHGAYLPEMPYPEAVFAKVLQGEFALRVQNDVIVDPQAAEIAILAADPEIEPGTSPEQAHDFTQIGAIPSDTCAGLAPGAPATTLCLINPGVIADLLGEEEDQTRTYFVELRPGDTVYIPAGSECFFCNITGQTGDDPGDANTQDRAQLLAWSSPTFSWEQMAATPRSNAIRGWMRNPGSPCH